MTQTTVTVEQREEFAASVERLASAAAELSTLWTMFGLPGDFYTKETGYPFEESVDEVAVRLWEWADAVRQDAEIAAGRA